MKKFTELERQAVFSAFDKLDYYERADINRIAKQLVAEVKTRNKIAQFSQQSAVELLGKIGILLVQEDKNENR